MQRITLILCVLSVLLAHMVTLMDVTEHGADHEHRGEACSYCLHADGVKHMTHPTLSVFVALSFVLVVALGSLLPFHGILPFPKVLSRAPPVIS